MSLYRDRSTQRGYAISALSFGLVMWAVALPCMAWMYTAKKIQKMF